MMNRRKELLIPLAEIKKRLQFSSRGDIKIVVPSIWEKFEYQTDNTVWQCPDMPDAQYPATVLGGAELAYFNERTVQDRHWHKIGIEIFVILEGSVLIEVEGREHLLQSGDCLPVPTELAHEVRPIPDQPFLAQVFKTAGGMDDKFTE